MIILTAFKERLNALNNTYVDNSHSIAISLCMLICNFGPTAYVTKNKVLSLSLHVRRKYMGKGVLTIWGPTQNPKP